MAKIMLGPTIGMASGSVGATVYSHNRYGTYMRRRATPTKSVTSWALAAKAKMTAATQAWQGLTKARQQVWNAYASSNPVPGALGMAQALTGHAAFVGNHVRMVMVDETPLVAPPLTPAPAGLLTLSVEPSKTLGTCKITFTPTPTGAEEVLWILACYAESNGISWIQNKLRWVDYVAKEQTSPCDIESNLVDRIGDMVIGQRLFMNVGVMGTDTGQLSALQRCEALIV